VFLDHLRTDVVEPVQKTQDLINSLPYVTRLYSTMSADEMTLDPAFTFNPDLAPVSNLHKADLFIECKPSLYEYEAPWRLVLPRGGTIRGDAQSQSRWPLTAGGTMPANLRIVQLSESGSGEIITDNSNQIAAMVVSNGGMASPSTMLPGAA